MIYPKSDENLEANLENKAIKKAACIHETQNGDLNSLSIVFDWLKQFAQQLSLSDNPKQKRIILANSYVYLKLCLLGQKEPEVLDEINRFLGENRIRFVFYPTESNSSNENLQIPILDGLFWQIVGELSLRVNPSSQLAFLQAFRQSLREVLEHKSEMRAWFMRFAQVAEIDSYMEELIPKVVELPPPPVVAQETVSSSSSKEDVRTIKREDSRLSISEFSQDSSNGGPNSNGSGHVAVPQSPAPVKLTEAEVNEYCQWVDDMSKIGKVKLLIGLFSHIVPKNIQNNSLM